MSSSFIRHYDETKTLSYAIPLISPTWSDGIQFGLYMIQDSELFIADFAKTPVNKGFVLSRIYNPIARSFFKEKSYREFIKNIGLFTYWKNNSFPVFCYEIDDNDFACGEP